MHFYRQTLTYIQVVRTIENKKLIRDESIILSVLYLQKSNIGICHSILMACKKCHVYAFLWQQCHFLRSSLLLNILFICT